MIDTTYRLLFLCLFESKTMTDKQIKSNFGYDRANVCRKIEICETLSNFVDEKFNNFFEKC